MNSKQHRVSVILDTWKALDGWRADVTPLTTADAEPIYTTPPHSTEIAALLDAEAWCERNGWPAPDDAA